MVEMMYENEIINRFNRSNRVDEEYPYEDQPMYSNVINILLTKYYSVPSLHCLAVNSVATALWNHKEIHNLVEKSWLSIKDDMMWGFQYTHQMEWVKIKNAVSKNVFKLQLPFNSQQKVGDFIEPFCSEIKHWIDFHSTTEMSKLPDTFFWSKGTIDSFKIAESMMHDTTLPTSVHFQLACHHCMEDEIRALWPKLDLRWLCPNYNKSDLVLLWKAVLNGDGGIQNIPEYGIYCAVKCASKKGIEYFSNQLDQNRKSEVISSYVIYLMECRHNSPYLFLFLFHEMNEKDKEKWIHQNKYALLRFLFQWPCLKSFLQVVDALSYQLSVKEYFNLLQCITVKINDFPNCHSYRDVFRDFWSAIPVFDKEYVIFHFIEGSLLSVLFTNYFEDGARLIFETATVEQRKEMIFYHGGLNLCDHLIHQNRWKSLKMFILGCIADKKTFMSFDDIYTRRTLDNYRRRVVTKHKLKELRKFLETVSDFYS